MPIPNDIQSPEFASYLRRLTEPHVGMSQYIPNVFRVHSYDNNSGRIKEANCFGVEGVE